MIYKLASRDNVDHERFEVWPAVLNSSFTKFNNVIEETTFCTEDEILHWLESRSRTKISNRTINIQEFKNGNPNKIYSVYACDHENPNHPRDGTENSPSSGDRFLYSLRIRKPNEASMTFLNEKGVKMNSSFKKIENKIDYNILSNFEINYSSDLRIINGEYIEGIYPFEEDESDKLHKKYLEFVKDIHRKDNEENKSKEYSIVYSNSTVVSKWLASFIVKLDQVEKFLDFFAKGGSNQVYIPKDVERNETMRILFKLLSDNKKHTREDETLQTDIRNMMIDPVLSGAELYQVRYKLSLLSWHKNYSYMIRKLGVIPSEQFANMIIDFNLMDFFRQLHPKENIEAMIANVCDIYGYNVAENRNIDKMLVVRKTQDNKQQKFHTVVRTFD